MGAKKKKYENNFCSSDEYDAHDALPMLLPENVIFLCLCSM
ncbi:hypothetical protein [Salinimicrobium catena]|nr:hypothetical protein [Salinimicrobium catena]